MPPKHTSANTRKFNNGLLRPNKVNRLMCISNSNDLCIDAIFVTFAFLQRLIFNTHEDFYVHIAI